MINVLHICPYFPPAEGFGGVPQAVEALVKAQINQGLEVDVFTTNSRIQSINSLAKLRHKSVDFTKPLGNGHVYYFKNKIQLLADRYKFFTPEFSYADVETLIPQSVKIIHFHEVNIAGYKQFALDAIKNNKKVCVSLHGSFSPPTHQGLKKWIHDVIDPILQQQWFNTCHGFFITSDYEKEKLVQAGVSTKRIFEIPFGKPEIKYEKDFHFSIVSNDIPTVLVLGRLNTQKGIKRALDVYQHAKKNHFPLKMLFVGKNEGGLHLIQKFCLKNQIPFFINQHVEKEGIYIFPSIEQNALYDLFQKVDVTLCPSPYESFGLVALESLVSGTPIVISSHYGCTKFLSTNQSGAYIANDEINDFYNGLKKMLNQKDNKIKLEFPSWDDVARQYKEKYEQMIYTKDS